MSDASSRRSGDTVPDAGPAPSPSHEPAVRVVWRGNPGRELVRSRPAPAGVRIEVDPDATADRLDGAAILVDGAPPEELLDAPELRHVIVPYAGVRASLRTAVAARPRLTLHNSHYNARFVAQHMVALLLAAAARLPRYDRALRHGDWRRPDGGESIDLHGRRALLLGYGRIGRAAVPMLHGFGMEVHAVRRRAGERATDDAGVQVHPADRLHELLGASDAVLISLPATDATVGLLDRAAFRSLKPGALLVNVGRGSVIEEAALHEALEAGAVTGAGLDVWWRYPEDRAARAATLPCRTPLLRHPDVIGSPHRADAVAGSEEACVADVFATIAALADGSDPARNRVDVNAGY